MLRRRVDALVVMLNRLLSAAAASLALIALTGPAHAGGAESTVYSQQYVVATPGLITVVCPDDRLPTDWYRCVPEAHGEGVPADDQIWIGGAGIDMPLGQAPVHIRIEDASGTPAPGGFCVDHDHDALCGPSDPVWEGGDEGVIFFCGETDVPLAFDSAPPAGRTLRHMDVWVRPVGHVSGIVTGDAVCSGLPGHGPFGIGTTGTIHVTAVPIV